MLQLATSFWYDLGWLEAVVSSWGRSTRWRVLRRIHSSCWPSSTPPHPTCSDQAHARSDSPPATGLDRPPGCPPSQPIWWTTMKDIRCNLKMSTCSVCWSEASRWSCSPSRLSLRSLWGSLLSSENLGNNVIRSCFVEYFRNHNSWWKHLECVGSECSVCRRCCCCLSSFASSAQSLCTSC